LVGLALVNIGFPDAAQKAKNIAPATDDFRPWR
jgi:hypothetical protein